MTFDEFFEWADGKELDYDGKFLNQCVDEIRFFISRCYPDLTMPGGVAGAKDFYYKFERLWNRSQWQLFKNTPDFLPQKGDIVIWDATPGNSAGHIAVFMGGDLKTFTSFDQNYPIMANIEKGIPGSPCHKVGHTYTNVLGFVRAMGGGNE